MENSHLKYLLKKYLENTATEAERREVDEWYENFEGQQGLSETMDTGEKADFEKRMLSRINTRLDARPVPGVPKIIPWRRIAVAASVLVVLSIGGYLALHRPQPVQQTAQNQPKDIAPGSNKAILTLANGKQIVVTGATNGIIARQANMTVSKTATGQLNYRQATGASTTAAPLMNTLSTQMGGETSLTLADGTEVKLDAASSITYPVAFTGKERRVSVTGQVHFKVKYDAKQPFLVAAEGQTIRDIGTEFNVNAYNGTRTTLIEGSITVNNQLLVPGQQATLGDNKLIIAPGDPEEAAAWANGYFRFNNENIHTIMDKIKRWYDIDVAYEPDATTEGITGTVSRYKNISQVFYMLSYTQKVHFKIEGRRVTVLK